MTTNITVLILMFNDSEFDLYKNKTFYLSLNHI